MLPRLLCCNINVSNAQFTAVSVTIAPASFAILATQIAFFKVPTAQTPSFTSAWTRVARPATFWAVAAVRTPKSTVAIDAVRTVRSNCTRWTGGTQSTWAAGAGLRCMNFRKHAYSGNTAHPGFVVCMSFRSCNILLPFLAVAMIIGALTLFKVSSIAWRISFCTAESESCHPFCFLVAHISFRRTQETRPTNLLRAFQPFRERNLAHALNNLSCFKLETIQFQTLEGECVNGVPL